MLKHLIIAGHPDDEVIGCSSILLEDSVGVLYITNDYGTANTARNEVKNKLALDFQECLKYPFFKMPDINELADNIKDVLDTVKPENVYVHHPKDLHQDHNAITKATLIAARMNRNDYIKSLSYYYVENPFELKACEFKKIDKDEKLKFLAKYKKYIPENHIKTILAFNEFVGAYSNLGFAEPFEIVYKRS